jgi:hypothetical protein
MLIGRAQSSVSPVQYLEWARLLADDRTSMDFVIQE